MSLSLPLLLYLLTFSWVKAESNLLTPPQPATISEELLCRDIRSFRSPLLSKSASGRCKIRLERRPTRSSTFQLAASLGGMMAPSLWGFRPPSPFLVSFCLSDAALIGYRMMAVAPFLSLLRFGHFSSPPLCDELGFSPLSLGQCLTALVVA